MTTSVYAQILKVKFTIKTANEPEKSREQSIRVTREKVSEVALYDGVKMEAYFEARD